MDNKLFTTVLQQAPAIKDALSIIDLANLSQVCRHAEEAIQDSASYIDELIDPESLSPSAFERPQGPWLPAPGECKRFCRGKTILEGKSPSCQGDLDSMHAYAYRDRPQYRDSHPPMEYIPRSRAPAAAMPAGRALEMQKFIGAIGEKIYRQRVILSACLASFFFQQPLICLSLLGVAMGLAIHQIACARR